MVATTITCGIKRTIATPPCDDLKITSPQTNKSTTIVIGIDSHIQFRLAK